MTYADHSAFAVTPTARSVASAPRHLRLRHQCRRALYAAEWAFAVAGLFVFAGGFAAYLLSLIVTGDEPVERAWKLAQALMFLGSLAVLISRPTLTRRTVSRHPVAMVLLGVAIVSVTWSVSPQVTLTRAAVLAGTTLFGIYLAARFRSRELLLLLACVFAVTALASVVLIAVVPDRGIAGGTHVGSWRGVYAHKNAFGLHMALGAVVFVLLALDVRRRRWRWRWLAAAGACLCAVLVVGSRSVTALMLTAMAALSLPLLAAVRHRSMARLLTALGLLMLLGIGGMLLAIAPESLLAAVGKDNSLTGRFPLWAVLVQQLQERPWLGYGYGAFWTGWESGPSKVVADVAGEWYPWQAHNGWLNVALQLGIVGTLVLLLDFVRNLHRSVLTLRATSSGAGQWPVILLIFLLVASASESVFLRQDDFFWLVYVAVAFREREAAVPGSATGAATARIIGHARMLGGSLRWRRPSRLSPGVRRVLQGGRSND
jgi:exopolysaccharide production protein ExoQ